MNLSRISCVELATYDFAERSLTLTTYTDSLAEPTLMAWIKSLVDYNLPGANYKVDVGPFIGVFPISLSFGPGCMFWKFSFDVAPGAAFVKDFI